MNYSEFIERKTRDILKRGFDSIPKIKSFLRDDQKHIVKKSLHLGRYAIFADCGLGKTIDELEWARIVSNKHGTVLILCPLCVAIQTKYIGNQFGYDVNIAESNEDIKKDKINVTNYEKLHKFDCSKIKGIVLDESSILKNFEGAIRNKVIDSFQRTRFRLAATATPAPNDFMELGNHSEFLGIMTRTEMLSKYFVHDGGEVQKWRLKGHAVDDFWRWVRSWSVSYSKPSEINPSYSNEGFTLPDIIHHKYIINTGKPTNGSFFHKQVNGLSEMRQLKRESMKSRIDKTVEIVTEDNDVCVVWCDLNKEGDILEKEIPDAVQIKGSDSIERKEEILWAFTQGEIKRLVTKQKITSFGLNWQHCAKTVFASINYSFETAYQAMRRFYRFGQTKDVNVHWVMTDRELGIWKALQTKTKMHEMARIANVKAK